MRGGGGVLKIIQNCPNWAFNLNYLHKCTTLQLQIIVHGILFIVTFRIMSGSLILNMPSLSKLGISEYAEKHILVFQPEFFRNL